MKKVISMMLLALLILTSLAGCGTPNKKSEAELKEEIRKELEAEMAAEKEADKSNTPKVDMKDMDAIYEFVKQDIKDLSREDFDLWEVSYLDITGDGNDEAVIAGVHGVEWPQKMQVISGDSGEYKRIPSDISLYKYENKPELRDGFFVVTGRTGGTGTESSFLDLYIYNGSEIINALSGLEIFYRYAGVPDSNVDVEVTGEIEGKLTDFMFTVTEHDNVTGKDTIKKKEQYIYNADTKSFDVESNEEQIILSALMTMDEITNKLGSDYTFKTEADGGYFMYYSELKYDGIAYTFFHDTEKLSSDKRPDSILITSNKYTFNYDFKIGDPVLKAIEYCENNFENAYDRHSDTDIFDWFNYREKKSSGELVDTGYILAFGNDAEERYSNKSEISEDVKIKSINIFAPLD